MKLVYESRRLLLKVLDQNDSEKVLDYILRNKKFFYRFEPQREEDFYTIEFQTNELKNDRHYIEEKSMLRLWMFKKDNPERIIGQITFYNIVPYAFLSCHIGYKSDENEANKGFVTEAVNKGVEIMFSEYGMHRIEAHVLSDNKASIKVLEKVGFVNEGVAHKFLEVNGVWQDHLHFAKINE